MASVIVLTNPASEIEYSIASGNIVAFDLRGCVLYDVRSNIEMGDWKSTLIDFVIENKLHKPNRWGVNAYISKLINDGLLPEWVENDELKIKT